MTRYYKLFTQINLFYETYVKQRKILEHRGVLEESQWWSIEKLREFQRKELHKLLDHAYVQVPYWKGAFDKLGLQPSDIKTYEDIRKLPIIDKDMIRTHYDNLVALNYRGKTWHKSTGGSTGQPLHFEYTPDSYDWRVAASKRGYSWAGCQDGAKQAYIWGVAIGKTPFFRGLKESIHHSFLRQKYYNCFGFTKEKMAEALRDMNKFKPEFIVGYTNPLYEFAKYVEKAGTLKFKLRTIISAAEKLHEFQREKIRDVFECPVFNTYGSREFMLIASECEAHKGLHINIENLLVEIIKENGEPAKPGEIGNIVITDLHNYGMPFIRYKIGDLGVATDRICTCGRGLPLIDKIEGRVLDVIKTPDGKIVPGEFFPHLMKDFTEVRKFQVIQDRFDHLLISIVKEVDFTNSRLALVKDEIYKITGHSIMIDIKFVDEIPLTVTGKHMVTISQI